jgi:hypothetical protein
VGANDEARSPISPSTVASTAPSIQESISDALSANETGKYNIHPYPHISELPQAKASLINATTTATPQPTSTTTQRNDKNDNRDRCVDDVLLACNSERPASGAASVVLIERGINTFADKMRNAAAADAVGVLVCDSQEQPLFRMVSANAADAGAEILPHALLISKESGAFIHTLLKGCLSSGGSVKIRSLEACTVPRAFICIGRVCAHERGHEAEVLCHVVAVECLYLNHYNIAFVRDTCERCASLRGAALRCAERCSVKLNS